VIQGRYYAGRPILAQFCPVTDFKDARCRQFEETSCSRGGYCNFMHLKKVSSKLQRRLLRRLEAERCAASPPLCSRFARRLHWRRRAVEGKGVVAGTRVGYQEELHAGPGARTYYRRALPIPVHPTPPTLTYHHPTTPHPPTRRPRRDERSRRDRRDRDDRRGGGRSRSRDRTAPPEGGGREGSAERRAKIAEWNRKREGGGEGREGSEERRAKIANWNFAREGGGLGAPEQ
jgi:splicing factor U2AF subunit